MSVAAFLLLLVAPPLLLVRLTGWPVPAWPSLAQVEQWVADPITTQTVTGALTVVAWLLWLLMVGTIALRLLARVRTAARWMRRMPLPTPLQATATGLAGVAVLGTHTGTAGTPVLGQPATTTPTVDNDRGDLREPQSRQAPDQPAEAAGVVVPGGWLPQETAEQIAAAGALLWLRRRRSYRPDVPDPARHDADLVPLPAVVAAAQTAVATEPDGPRGSTGQGTPGAGRQDGDASVVVFPPGGVSLTGPGASDAARGILITAALQALRDPRQSVRLVTTHADVDVLLNPHPRTASVAGIHVAPTVDDAITAVTSRPAPSPVHRGEDQTGQDRLLLLTHAPTSPQASSRLAEIVARTDVALIVVGELPASDNWSVDSAGHIHSHHDPARRRGRLCVLDMAAARDLLTVISPADVHTAARTPSPPPLVPRPRTPHHTDDETSTTPRRSDAPVLRLRVLGGVTVSFQGTPVVIRRSAALQALVFLAVHPHGATGRDLVEAIWPGLPAHRVTGRLYTTMSDLRKAMREACGAAPIEHVNDRYRLNPGLDVDLWRLHHAVRQATTAVTDRTRAWQAVIDEYGGALADGYTWPWLEAHREVVRRHVIDAHVALADGQADPRQALALLQDAIRVDPYNEDLHRRAAKILTALGDHAAASELLDAYAQRLAQAGLTPTHLLSGTGHQDL
ncbi:AfsR/SARP family transcriptional regulator [Micromonospora inyonensis]|uniref:AfsR/SARP family transcriptional regulator n=1 Tax=Micromonospora inyonensis TaxID=47866 RepID=UPI000B8089F1|nr:BTAD domain-containing putative transcriptional regulator [Micromonospora inyonensis]